MHVFDKFCNEVTHHQELLKLSKLKNLKNETQIITAPTSLLQLSPAIVSKANGTLIITVQASPATSESVLKTKTYEPYETDLSTHYETVEKSDQVYTTMLPEKRFGYDKTSATLQIIDESRINSINIEHELDELTTDDIAVESDNEHPYNEDENVVDDLDREKFKDFPKLIEDSKLLYKGRDLLNMISKFYTLKCDQWYVYAKIFFAVEKLFQYLN